MKNKLIEDGEGGLAGILPVSRENSKTGWQLRTCCLLFFWAIIISAGSTCAVRILCSRSSAEVNSPRLPHLQCILNLLIVASSVFMFNYNSGGAGWSFLWSEDSRCREANGMFVPKVARRHGSARHSLCPCKGVELGQNVELQQKGAVGS